MRVLHVVGARPNFMKTAPIMAAMRRRTDFFEQRLVHTGQHYDHSMSATFFEDLHLPEADVHLGVGSGTHAEQTARVMIGLEPVLTEWRPDLVIVVGDVNSTLAAALVATKKGIRVAHVEAGLRSFDRTMPEEVNRLLTDQISDLLFTSEESGNENLRREGIPAAKIHFVGNVMIDSLVRLLPRAARSSVVDDLALTPRGYAVVTLHRPSNVDDPVTFREVMTALTALARELPVVFPVHPRTRERLAELAFDGQGGHLRMIDPLGYLDFLSLWSNARIVLTDSGGLQEETTYLGIPCLTLRSNTERPSTLIFGTNRLVASRSDDIQAATHEILADPVGIRGTRPPHWDGHAAERIVAVLSGEARPCMS